MNYADVGCNCGEKPTKVMAAPEEPAAADNKVIITQALQMLTAGAGEAEHLERCSCSSDMLYAPLNKGATRSTVDVPGVQVERSPLL